MDILKHIIELRDERGWTNYRLAEEAQLNISTLQNMFIRQTMPAMSTITAICDAFGITLSQFFCDNEKSLFLTNEEIELINSFRQLDKKIKVQS